MVAAARSTETRIAGARGTAGIVHCSILGGATMRWKIGRHGHDPRQVDLLAVIALVIVIAAAWRYFGERTEPPSTTAFIVPSQSAHW
jgi:hypothetical protein